MARQIIRFIALLLCFSLAVEQSGFAQVAASHSIAPPGAAANLEKFRPLHLRYLSYDRERNNFRLFLDKGSLPSDSGQVDFNSHELLKYFLIGITLPDSSFWVNLRPDGADTIIDPALALTDIGKIMLESDVQLKQDTARFTSPDTPEGKEYWDKLYSKAAAIFGNDTPRIPTITRPWIVPDEIIIKETTDSAYVYKATLKVMLERDYVKGLPAYEVTDSRLKQLNEYSTELVRELILPGLTREINTARRYAALRQVYYSLIFAQWFKARFRGQATECSKRIESGSLTGLTSRKRWSKDEYFQAYQESFKKGEYDFKKTILSPTAVKVRSYFSGGENLISPDLTTVLSSPSARYGNAIVIRAAAPATAGNHEIESGVSAERILAPGIQPIRDRKPALTEQKKQELLRKLNEEESRMLAKTYTWEPYDAPDYDGQIRAYERLIKETTNVPWAYFKPNPGSIIEFQKAIASNIWGILKENVTNMTKGRGRAASWLSLVFSNLLMLYAQTMAPFMSTKMSPVDDLDMITVAPRPTVLPSALIITPALSLALTTLIAGPANALLWAALITGVTWVITGLSWLIFKHYPVYGHELSHVLQQGIIQVITDMPGFPYTHRQLNDKIGHVRREQAVQGIVSKVPAPGKVRDIIKDTFAQARETLWDDLGMIKMHEDTPDHSTFHRRDGGSQKSKPVLTEERKKAIRTSISLIEENMLAQAVTFDAQDFTDFATQVQRYEKFIHDSTGISWSYFKPTLGSIVEYNIKTLKDIKSFLIEIFRQPEDSREGLLRILMLTGFLCSQSLNPFMDITTDDGELTSTLVSTRLTVFPTAVIVPPALSFLAATMLHVPYPAIWAAYFSAFVWLTTFSTYRNFNRNPATGHELSHVLQYGIMKQLRAIPGFPYSFDELDEKIGHINKELPLLGIYADIPTGSALKTVITSLVSNVREMLRRDYGIDESYDAPAREKYNPLDGNAPAARDGGTRKILLTEEEIKGNASIGGSPMPVEAPGGIDFRYLPLVINAEECVRQHVREISASEISCPDLGKEWREIERMLNAGILPSSERIFEYLHVSSIKGEEVDQAKIATGIKNILRLEEEKAGETDYKPTDSLLKSILILLESEKSTEELVPIFSVPIRRNIFR